jgi:Zn finger protein HypA/HybF involved in hydrogenase expression
MRNPEPVYLRYKCFDCGETFHAPVEDVVICPCGSANVGEDDTYGV